MFEILVVIFLCLLGTNNVFVTLLLSLVSSDRDGR